MLLHSKRITFILQTNLPTPPNMIKSIHPPYWFAGMRDSSLQLLIEHDEGYEFLDVSLKGCKPGKIVLNANIKGVNTPFEYMLHERRKRGDGARGFSTADVIYLIMPDRFATDEETARHLPKYNDKPSAYHGGTINGIRQHLDYLEDLGVTTLWLTPVVNNSIEGEEESCNAPYHGYAATDYYSVDHHLGTLEDYCLLVKEAHGRGLKVIKDIVFNHCGVNHPWMKHTPMADWVNHSDGELITNYRLTPVIDPYAADIDKRQTVEGWFVKSMPDLNIRNERMLRYFTQCTYWWIETTGIDGIRMDTFPYADGEAMQQWLRQLHKDYPNFRVVGEAWVCNSAFTAKMQEGELDSSMDFALFEAFNYAKHEESDEVWSGMNRIYNTLCYDYLYRNPRMTMAFLDNHDVNRFLEIRPTKKAIERLKVAMAVMLTIPRIPQIYYGTEVLMNGTTAKTDADVRTNFPGGFPKTACNAFSSEGRTREQKDMHRFVRRLLKWRKGNDVIAEGCTKQFLPYKGVYVIARYNDSGTVLTIVNGNSKANVFRPERYREVIGEQTEFVDVASGKRYNLSKEIRLAPNKVLVLTT